DIKLPLRDEQGQVVGVVGLAEDVTERLRAERDLQTQRRLLQAVFDAVPFWITVRDRQGHLRMVNRRLAADYGREPEDFVGHSIAQDRFMTDEEKTRIEATVQEMRQTQRPVVAPEVPVTLPGNKKILLRMVQIPLFDNNGWFDGSVGLGEDITDRRKAEAALLQTQKLESLGVLAGGIAHDFNNLLVTILGNASLALLKLPGGTPAHEELSQIELAGQRAADLCRQLLSYAGKSRMEMEATNLNALVQEMPQLLKVSLPKGVTVNFNLAPTLPAVNGDPTQIRQVLMNLVINAGEAIGERTGVITISTGVLQADHAYLALAHMEPDPPEGPYVFLEVSDTGIGMSPETQARIFDPFFTTKFTGRGLGLASVLGIIRSHKGGLKVYSELGVGTSFKVLLPAAEHPQPAPERPPAEGPWRGSGTVLVVDDEASIRSVTRRMLAHLGFEVLEAADGQQALAALREHRDAVKLVVLDLTMPNMSGAETL
ncbi:MAG TPA: PAS domain-containing protein, partial [bacterium]|nr:PAS domain-containing protein [bacterium]